MRSLSRLFRFITIPVLSLFLFACGGGGGGGTTGSVSPASTGTVTLLVTDAPSDDFNAIILSVTRVELFCASGKVEVFSGFKKFDLLKLANVTEIFAEKDVPVGICSKIRLTLKEIELVMKDGSREYPKLPGNGKLDLNPRGGFEILPYTRLFIQLDMDAEKSIKVHETGNGKYQFRPVVFVKIVTDSFGTKLVRLEGFVDNLDAASGSFELCRIQAQGELLDDDSEDGDPYCVTINTTQANASFFDSDGDPTTIKNLADGDFVTAVGRFSFAGYRVTASRHDDDDGSSDDDSSDDDADRQLVLNAEIVWQDNDGNYDQFRGLARSEVTTDEVTIDNVAGTDIGAWFKFDTFPGQEACGGSDEVSIPALVQDGTRLYDRFGNELGADDVQPGIPTLIDGVCDDGKGGVGLKSAMITLDLHSIFQTQLVGTIADVKEDLLGVPSGLDLVTDEEVDGTTDHCVIFNDGMQVFETIVEDDVASFRQRTVFSLADGQRADVFGDEYDVTGCLKADTIIYQEEEAVFQPI